AGIDTIVLERGEYPGAKNITGGILFTTILGKLIPNFLEEAPLERYIVERKFSLLSKDTELSFSFRTEKFSQPPYNNSFTVLRAKFDPWFAKKTEEMGVMILTKVTVDEIIWEKTRCVGVRTRLNEGDIYSDVVVLAEGANSVLAEKEGLKSIPSEKNMAIAVKEIISLPQEVIEERFHLSNSEKNGKISGGVAIEYFGDAVKGMFGNAFIYTNKDSLSVGVGCTLNELSKKNINPHDILEYFKNHPCVSNLLCGGKTEEYSAHMIPEGGYYNIPRVVFDGLLLIGDCAGLVNTSFFHEGTNLAMASGVYAAETIIEAKRKREFSYRILSSYENKLR
ncbi:MAG: FAD-dependent oxidoreductase, partial [Elusimicrobiota bacterium]|nr:FAD-dependent oxidoreductase [Elusimicrobiota bacterium]